MKADRPLFGLARLRTAAWIWIAVGAVAILLECIRRVQLGLTDGGGSPLGEDFINYWSGAALMLRGHANVVYHYIDYHSFLQTVAGAPVSPNFNYSYPPVLLILTVPFALLPYVPSYALWQVGGWFAFYRTLAQFAPSRPALLWSLATPAVFVNAMGGQNGTWTAAFIGGGLALLDRNPAAAGALLGLMVYKPHLALLLPVALLAGRRWRAFTAMAATALSLIIVSAAVLGWQIWFDYAAFADILRRTVLENGVGVWHRMVSVFIFVLRLTGSVPLAYAVQALIAAAAACIVAVAWASTTPAALRNSLLVLGTLLATPYLQDYDLVMSGLVALWLIGDDTIPADRRSVAIIVVALLLIAPAVAGLIGKASGLALGTLFIAPTFILAAGMLSKVRANPAESCL